MKLAHLALLGGMMVSLGGCSTYETSTRISPTAAPYDYEAESTILRKKLFKKPLVKMRTVAKFDVRSGISLGVGVDGEAAGLIRILPNPEADPEKVEVHYYVEEEAGFPALDRQEVVDLPEA